MAAPDDELRRRRRERLQADRTMLRDLAARYGIAWAAIRNQLDKTTADIQAARSRGERVSQAWLIRQGSLDRLEHATLAEIRLFLDYTGRRITDEQAAAIAAGHTDARTLLQETLGPLPPGAEPFRPVLPTEQLAEMVGRSSSGRPLGELLAGLAPDAAQTVRNQLIVGVAAGRNPRATARMMRGALNGNLARALTIARTETLGVYRTATLNSYRANAGIVDGWIWHAELGRRTCPVCWAMHGTFHTLDETLDSHPSCRCAMLPATKPWADLGFPGVPETRAQVEPGDAIFARQPFDLQRQVLGPGKHAAYLAGDLQLADLVRETHHPRWGRGLREAALREVLPAR